MKMSKKLKLKYIGNEVERVLDPHRVEVNAFEVQIGKNRQQRLIDKLHTAIVSWLKVYQKQNGTPTDQRNFSSKLNALMTTSIKILILRITIIQA